jgi:cytidylate kinase
MYTPAGQIVTALVGAELTVERSERFRYRPHGQVVTIAHELGSGGQAIAKALAGKLDVEYYDHGILERIVAAVPEERALMERLDEHAASTWAEVVHQLTAGKSALNEYRRRLVAVVLDIARKRGVIVGRGAHLILSQYHVFRVRVVGSRDACARRLLEQERDHAGQKLGWEEALRCIARSRHEDAEFIRQQFHTGLDDPGAFDLAVNTDRIAPEAAPRIILRAMRIAGFIDDRATVEDAL